MKRVPFIEVEKKNLTDKEILTINMWLISCKREELLFHGIDFKEDHELISIYTDKIQNTSIRKIVEDAISNTLEKEAGLKID